ncbi:hypothetical protein ETQ85_03260 [Zoogloea oleivorans]|uniref:Calcium-binding protein n=1 Tax=Zoogloea oleivorans TaxID=1552750 RepID=A0A6C2D6H0_9RHOO|nr:hypothetical protein [Zoogloea oleivorans]TYC61686.1 hypothetical protein ETQ85_03260 [Zoogloea oleivorans]
MNGKPQYSTLSRCPVLLDHYTDTIRFYWSEEGGLADKILFKNVRSSSELIFSRLDADSLVVSVVGTSDSILVRDFFHFYSFGGAYSECADVNISYVDEGGVERRVSGNIIREALLAPTSGGDLIIGLNGSNDRIVGLGGDDTLIAIGGEDTLVGGAGSDVYGVFLDYYHYRCVVIDNFDAAAKDEDFDVINGESDMYADAVGVVRVNDDLCLSFARVEDNKRAVSTLKCNTGLKVHDFPRKDLCWGFKVEAFARAVV